MKKKIIFTLLNTFSILHRLINKKKHSIKNDLGSKKIKKLDIVIIKARILKHNK